MSLDETTVAAVPTRVGMGPLTPGDPDYPNVIVPVNFTVLVSPAAVIEPSIDPVACRKMPVPPTITS